MIIHFANQSHIHRPANFWKFKKKQFSFQIFHDKKLWKVVQSIWYRKSISIIYYYICVRVWHFNDLSQVCKPSEFTGWAIIEELSIRRRLHTFLISWRQKTRVKHCYVDLSSWYELWFAIICIGMDVIFGSFYHNPIILETVAWVNTENLFDWNTTTWNNFITDVSLLV